MTSILYTERASYPMLRLRRDVRGGALVGGWMVRDWETETLYAEFEDGTVKRWSHKMKDGRSTPHFNRAGRKWQVVEAVPDNAEWIGHYPADM